MLTVSDGHYVREISFGVWRAPCLVVALEVVLVVESFRGNPQEAGRLFLSLIVSI